MSALVPDPKAGAAALAPGSEACSCCEGIDVATPQAHENRYGLPAVSYRIGAWAQFRESLIDGLSDSAFAPLDRLRVRDPDDFTIGLIDAFACAADVLTFYQERLANESWLRTAKERASLREMARLIGYRLRPGVAAETWLAFAMEAIREPPPNLPREPGSFVTGIPAELTIEPGLKVQSVPGPNEKPQTFETVERLLARPQWNAMRPWLSEPRSPAAGDTFAWLRGVATALHPGDAILFVGAEFESGASSTAWAFRIVTDVRPDADRDRTSVSWSGALDALAPTGATPGSGVRVFALRQRASVFGHNAPMWRTMPKTFRDDYEAGTGGGFSTIAIAAGGIDFGVGPGGLGGLGDFDFGGSLVPLVEDWPKFVISPAGSTSSGGHVDLDAAYPSIATGGFAVLARGSFDDPGATSSDTAVEVFRVAAASEVSREEFALSGKSTRLRLVGGGYDKFRTRVRQTRVFAASEELRLAPYPVETAVAESAIPVAVVPADLESGRRVIVQGRSTSGAPVVHFATLTGPARADGDLAVHGARAILDITPPLPLPLVRDSVTVAANVALARHGETVAQIVGSGDASRAHQRFELKHLPLTWRSAPTELGAASELTLRVGGVEWKERPTLFGAAPADRVFTLVTDEAGRDWVVFGDGRNGARLPSGVNNVRANSRKGLGVEGNVRLETLTQLMTRPLGLKSVANPAAAQGGTDPEPADQARTSIPLGTRTLGRAVSLLDYEDFARAYTGIAKAQAAVLRLGHGSVIAVTVAGQGAAAIDPGNPIWRDLGEALRSSGDPYVGLQLLGFQHSTFRLALKVKVDPDHERDVVLRAVESALRSAFSFARRELGQPVQQSEVVAVVHTVPGVIAVDLDRLYGGTAPFVQTLPGLRARLLASRMRVDGGVVRPAELLTLDPGPLDHLDVMS